MEGTHSAFIVPKIGVVRNEVLGQGAFIGRPEVIQELVAIIVRNRN